MLQLAVVPAQGTMDMTLTTNLIEAALVGGLLEIHIFDTVRYCEEHGLRRSTEMGIRKVGGSKLRQNSPNKPSQEVHNHRNSEQWPVRMSRM